MYWVGKEGEEREDIKNVRNCLSSIHAREGGGREREGEGGSSVCMCVCWLLPSNQSFYKQIVGQVNGVGDHRVG